MFLFYHVSDALYFCRFVSWFVGVVLCVNLVSNIRLMSRVAKKKLLKGKQPAATGHVKSKEQEEVELRQKQYDCFLSLLIFVCTILLALLVLVFLFECKIVNSEGYVEGKNTEVIVYAVFDVVVVLGSAFLAIRTIHTVAARQDNSSRLKSAAIISLQSSLTELWSYNRVLTSSSATSLSSSSAAATAAEACSTVLTTSPPPVNPAPVSLAFDATAASDFATESGPVLSRRRVGAAFGVGGGVAGSSLGHRHRRSLTSA